MIVAYMKADATTWGSGTVAIVGAMKMMTGTNETMRTTPLIIIFLFTYIIRVHLVNYIILIILSTSVRLKLRIRFEISLRLIKKLIIAFPV